jgi:hypothetical protein
LPIPNTEWYRKLLIELNKLFFYKQEKKQKKNQKKKTKKTQNKKTQKTQKPVVKYDLKNNVL